MGSGTDTGGISLDARLLEDIERLARIGVWTWVPANDAVTWSPGMYRILGIAASEPASLGAFMARVHPEDRARVERNADDARAGRAAPLEYRIAYPDGTVRLVRHEMRQAEDGGQVVGTLQDVTEHGEGVARELATLRRARQAQRQVWELATSPAVARGDLPSIARAATESVARLLDIARVSVWMLAEEDTALSLVDLYEAPADVHSADMVLAAADYPAYFAALTAGRVIDAHDARTDPRTREFTSGYLVPLGIVSMMDSAIRVSGRVVGVVCVEHVADATRTWTATDMTLASEVADQIAQTLHNRDRLAAEAQVRALNTELERRVEVRTAELARALAELEAFSYSIAHDLRAPVRHLHGYAHLLLEDAADRLDDRSRGYVDHIVDACGRLGALIDALLELSRLGRRDLAVEVVDMDALAREVWRELAARQNLSDVDLVCGALPSCRGDAVLLRQVWINLLDNAIKYSAPRDRPRVEISCEQDGDMVWYHVVDNGVGFAPDHADRVFGVFRRLHGHDEFEGNGVGLALVERIVGRHGGAVAAWSDGATGARVSFSLRCRD